MFGKDRETNTIVAVCSGNMNEETLLENINRNLFIVVCVFLSGAQVEGTTHSALYTNFLITQDVHWINEEPCELKTGNGVFRCSFRFQHRNPLVPCSVYKASSDRLFIRLGVPLRAIAKGQVILRHLMYIPSLQLTRNNCHLIYDEQRAEWQSNYQIAIEYIRILSLLRNISAN